MNFFPEADLADLVSPSSNPWDLNGETQKKGEECVGLRCARLARRGGGWFCVARVRAVLGFVR